MTESTEEFWDVDGETLQTYAYNIVTIGGDRLAPPPLRGGNLLIPARAGTMWMPKVVDTRVITLGMWVVGANTDGSIPEEVTMKAKFDANYRMLRNLLWNPNSEFTLTKRFNVDGHLVQASAQAQFVSGLVPTMNGRTRAAFTVDLQLANPYFYSEPVITTLATGSQFITLDGDAATNRIGIHFNGPRVNPKVRNDTMGVEVEYHATLVSGDQVDVDVDDYTSVTDPNVGLPYNSVGAIRHSGDVSWLLLQPGLNEIEVSSTSGIGSVVLTHQAAWL